MNKIKVIIMGAAGRDFHDFNMVFRDNPKFDVVAFTAAQIPNIDDRRYPKVLAGKFYPRGIQIHHESALLRLIKEYKVDYVYFSYSDVTHEEVMHRASMVLSSGADFGILGTDDTFLLSKVPVVAVTAVRTGAGKSPLSRWLASFFKKRKVVVIRHPMPYGDLAKQAVQRFETYEDLDKNNCTIEEREEYEPHINKGVIVYAGVDYAAILKRAEKEADLIIWDGGNNDLPFIKPDLHLVVADPHRAGHEMRYHPGEANFRRADIIVIGKMNTAPKDGVEIIEKNAKLVNPGAKIVKAAMKLNISDSNALRGKRVLVVEDGPTLTHGGMSFGAGTIVARAHGGKIVDARKYAVGSIKKVYEKFLHLKKSLPAMGYGRVQVAELQKTINRAKCDVVIDGTPVNLSRLLKINKPIVNVDYEFEEIGNKLKNILKKFERNKLR